MWCEGFSLPPAPGAWASAVLSHVLSGCGSRALGHRLRRSAGAELLRGTHVAPHVRVHVPAQSCRLFMTPWAVVHQGLLPMAVSEQEWESGLPFPLPGDPPDPGMEPPVSALAEVGHNNGKELVRWRSREGCWRQREGHLQTQRGPKGVALCSRMV